jgi:hypothetical protein
LLSVAVSAQFPVYVGNTIEASINKRALTGADDCFWNVVGVIVVVGESRRRPAAASNGDGTYGAATD